MYFLARFLLNNYKQALEVMQDMPICIKTLNCRHHLTDAQFAGWLWSERQYIQSRQAEPEADALGVEYVEMLNKYYNAWYHFLCYIHP